jgi:hypothetical protein
MTNTAIIRRLFLILVVGLLTLPGLAQENTLQAGDPPIASQITVTEVDDVTVNVIGEAGAVFPSAGVIVRNIYPGATVTTIAIGDGSFEVAVSGTEQMQYQVNTVQTLPQTIIDPLPGVGTIVYPDYGNLREGQPIPFAIGGQLAYGAAVWFGEGQINQLNFNAGDELSLTLNVRMFLPVSESTPSYTMRGQLALRRLFDENGRQLSTAIGAGDDWSSELTPTGLPILGWHVPDTIIAQAETERLAVDEETGEVSFRLEFTATIPDDLPAGIYVPVFTGQTAIADSEPFDWYANRIFSTIGENSESDPSTVLPLVLRVGHLEQLWMYWNLIDNFAERDANSSFINLQINAVNFAKQPNIISLSPSVYLPFFMYDDVNLQINIVDPEGNQSSYDLPTQMAVEGGKFKLAVTDLDSTSLFELYGNYDVEVIGTIRDSFGHSYERRDSFGLNIAEPLILRSAILPGTPFENGDTFNSASELPLPFSAFVRISVRHQGFEDSVQPIYDNSNDLGYFDSLYPSQFTQEGEYEVDYATEFREGSVRLWKSFGVMAGIVTSPKVTANGVMGLAGYDRNQQAWFDTRSYPTDAPDVPAFVNFPYFQGDVVYIPDGADSGLNPVLTGGDYQYLSIVRPDVTVRQFVRDSDATFDARVSNDDLLGGQIGAGSAGNRPGDVLFLFGGTVAGDDIRGYSALAVVTNEASARVVPPFTEPLFTLLDEPIYMFVLPTGVRPGQVLEVGNKFAHVGYVAPTVAADVYTEIITPSGEVIQNTTTANTFGYFYEPSHDFTVTETGVYRVFTQASYNGITSAGQLNDTFTGHPLGAEEYFVFVVPEGESMLTTPRESVSEVASGQPFTINIRAPEAWTDVAAYYVVRTASTILEQGTLDTFANQTNYQFNWSQISRTFPNIESAATEPSDMDEITFSFAMTGLDTNGNPQIQARVFTLRGNLLYTSEN